MMNYPATIRKPSEGRRVVVVGDLYRFLATGEETDQCYAMWEAIVPPDGGHPPHIHSREEESFYILDCEVTLTVGDEKNRCHNRHVCQHAGREPSQLQERHRRDGPHDYLRCTCCSGEDVLRDRRAIKNQALSVSLLNTSFGLP